MKSTMRTRGLLHALLLMAAACLGSAAPDAARAYEDGWQPCAEEGQSCNVSGRAVVRFGTEGRWVSRSVFNSVECSNDAFGDPAPGSRKRCQVRVSGYEGGRYPDTAKGWSFCAAEGEVCRFKGMAEVRFGQGDRFTTRTAYGSVRCDVADFGDPAYGVTKFCEIRRSGGQSYENSTQGSWDGWAGGASGGGWRYCAPEGGTCRVSGNGTVRFGDGRNFRTRKVNGQVTCDTRTFGDPSYGVQKHCEVQGGQSSDRGPSGWTWCAAEGDRCRFDGFAQVRYGTDGRYVYRDGTDGVSCSSQQFGNDPYPNRRKNCEVRR